MRLALNQMKEGSDTGVSSKGKSSCWWVVRKSIVQVALQVATSSWKFSDGKINVMLGRGTWRYILRNKNAGNGESLRGLEIEAPQEAGSGQVC